MRVLHVTPTWFDESSEIGGGERFPVELARAQAALGADVTLAAFGDRSSETAGKGFRIRVLRRQVGGRFSPLGFGLFRCLREADVIHCHQFHSLATNAAILHGKLTGKPVYYSDLGGGGWNLAYYINLAALSAGSLEISRHAADNPERPPRVSHVIHAGVDTERFSPDPDVGRDGSVLFVGRLLSHKGIDVLIRALPSGRTLNIVGRPGDDDYLSHLRELSRDKVVHFHVSVTDDELVGFYRRAAVCVLPSVTADWRGRPCPRAELFGLTLVEAMACGTPVIGSRITSIPEIISDDCGVLVPERDPEALGAALAGILDSDERRHSLGQAGRRRVMERFTWTHVAERCLAVYGG